jgi:hypothetical protein
MEGGNLSMDFEWIDVPESSRISAMAYDEENERILVRLRDGEKGWQYNGCPPGVWEEFSNRATSKGTFIHERLNFHKHGPLEE